MQTWQVALFARCTLCRGCGQKGFNEERSFQVLDITFKWARVVLSAFRQETKCLPSTEIARDRKNGTVVKDKETGQDSCGHAGPISRKDT